MESILNKLNSDNLWIEFLHHKTSKLISPSEINYYEDYIKKQKYVKITNKIINENYSFTYPKRNEINKVGKSKKRVIYSYNEDETMILKMINYLLYEYDYLFSSNLYSFRKNISVKNAIYDLTKNKKISNCYGYKLDIENYFNSIPVDKLLLNLKSDMKDEKLYNLLSSLLLNPYVIYNDKIIIEHKKGIMAGVPTSSFLANYYLKDIDKYFANNTNIIYARYSDDIIIFATSKDELLKYRQILLDFIKNYDLTVNIEKEKFYNPSEKFDFLGFSYQNNIIDLSDNSIRKIKKKIKRSARSIRRWSIKKNINKIDAIKLMNKKFNKKFFGKTDTDLTWKYYFFPIINTTKSLKEIDKYMQENLRYIVTGKYNKLNFKKVTYETLKNCNYKSLVHEYYEGL